MHLWCIIVAMSKAETFASKIGRGKLASTFGVGPTAVSNAIRRGQFPASWYDVSQFLAAEVGVDCPPELFGQKVAHSKKGGDAKRKIQGDSQ